MSDETFDHRYASIDKVHALETRVAVIENDIRNKLTNIEKQNDLILSERRQPAVAAGAADQLMLLGHRFMDKLDKMPTQARGGPPWLIMAGIVAQMPGALMNLLNNASYELTGFSSGKVGLEKIIMLILMFP